MRASWVRSQRADTGPFQRAPRVATGDSLFGEAGIRQPGFDLPLRGIERVEVQEVLQVNERRDQRGAQFAKSYIAWKQRERKKPAQYARLTSLDNGCWSIFAFPVFLVLRRSCEGAA
jgi:hypothetical protein